MSYIVDKDYIYNGLRCVIISVDWGQKHHCGYVGVSKDLILYGIKYDEEAEILQNPILLETLKKSTPDRRGILSYAFWEGEKIQLQILFNVHGSLTFSDGGDKLNYPIESNLWWFGFDCAHAGDTKDICNLDYCVAECNSLVDQILEVEKFIGEKGGIICDDRKL